MKLLILANNLKRAGFRQRFGVYLDFMKSCGIEPKVQAVDKSVFGRIRLYKQIDDYDAVILHKKCLSFFDGLFFRPKKAKVIFSFDDAIMFNDKGRQTRTHKIRFKRSLTKADSVIVGSEYLAQQARAYHKNINIIPLGLAISDYPAQIAKPQDGKIRLVWIGSTATLDYIKSITPVLQKLAGKYHNLVLRIICDTFIEIPGVTVEKIIWQAESRGQNLAQCDIGLAPLPDTPFTQGKCSFKVLEYSASGLPVVASPVGTNSDHIKDGQTGFLAVSHRQWCDKLSILIENSELRRQMGQKGREFAVQFDIAEVGKKLCQAVCLTVNQKR
jgi:glycosyltransferase involved in cell wall biosynthesis